MLIAQNVFLVVDGRVRPKELTSLFDRFGEAASQTRGLMPYRRKLFGNLIIIINNAQNWKEREESILSRIQRLDLLGKYLN